MGPANKQWIRSRMAGIKKAAGIAFSEEIFLSILICLIAKNKHLVLHTFPEVVPELKSVVEQHCAVIFGLTTATIVCHNQQTKTDIIGAITGRHADMVTHANSGVSSVAATGIQYPPYSAHVSIPNNSNNNNSNINSFHYSHSHHVSTPSGGHYYQYSNPGDEYSQRNRTRFEKSRRSVATNHSEASEISQRASEFLPAPSVASVRTTAGGGGGAERESIISNNRPAGFEDLDQQRSQYYHDQSEYSSRIGDDGSSIATTLRRADSRATRNSKPGVVSTGGGQEGGILMETLGSRSRPPNQYLQTPGHIYSASGSGVGKGNASIHSSQAPVTPVDFTFPRRRYESVSIQGGYAGGQGEPTGVTYGGRKIAQAIILDGLENASQEVYAVLLEMIINKGINDRNRYELPDLIIIAVFNSQNVPDNIPKQLLDYFAINCSYLYSIPQPRIPPPPRKHAHFRRTDWDELSKRMKSVTVSNDMMRYIRDVIVGVRTHEAIHGGLTARAAMDLELIMKTLAAIFQTTFVTPELLVTAAEKVFSHRLELKSKRRKKLLMNSSSSHGSSVSSTGSSPPPHPPIHYNGKAPLRSGEVGTSLLIPPLPTSGGTMAGGYNNNNNNNNHHEDSFRSHGHLKNSYPGMPSTSAVAQPNNSKHNNNDDNDASSFVELSDSEDSTDGRSQYHHRHQQQQSNRKKNMSSSVHQHQHQQHHSTSASQQYQEGGGGIEVALIEDSEKTAADVVKDVLKSVYPPI